MDIDPWLLYICCAQPVVRTEPTRTQGPENVQAVHLPSNLTTTEMPFGFTFVHEPVPYPHFLESRAEQIVVGGHSILHLIQEPVLFSHFIPYRNCNLYCTTASVAITSRVVLLQATRIV